jgi:hypothetical protein
MEKLIRCCRYAIVPSAVQRIGDRESRLDSAKTLERLPRSAMPNTRSHDTKPEPSWVSLKFFWCWGAIFMSGTGAFQRAAL